MNTSVAIMHIRMKPLPRRHRIAHLRALLRRPMACPVRRDELAALLRVALFESGEVAAGALSFWAFAQLQKSSAATQTIQSRFMQTVTAET